MVSPSSGPRSTLAILLIGATLHAMPIGRAPNGGVYDDTVDMGMAGPPPGPTSPPPIALDRRLHAVRARYGHDDFRRVKSIRFTVEETRDGSDRVRHWTWFPGEDSVYFQGQDPKGLVLQAGYSRKNPWSLGSETVARIDRTFLRDRFTLLFPQLFETDPGVAIRMEEGGKAGEKVSGTPADWIRIAFPKDDRFRSGETYEVLADTNGIIRAWTIPQEGTGSAAMRFEWSPPKKVDGLPLSLERKGPKGFAIRFTDVHVAGLGR